MFYQLLNSALRDSDEFRCHAKVIPNHFDPGKMKARRLGLIKTSMPSQPRHIPFLQLGLMPRVGRLVEPAAAGRGRGYTHGSGHSHVWFSNFMVRFKGAIQVMIYDDPGLHFFLTSQVKRVARWFGRVKPCLNITASIRDLASWKPCCALKKYTTLVVQPVLSGTSDHWKKKGKNGSTGP